MLRLCRLSHNINGIIKNVPKIVIPKMVIPKTQLRFNNIPDMYLHRVLTRKNYYKKKGIKAINTFLDNYYNGCDFIKNNIMVTTTFVIHSVIVGGIYVAIFGAIVCYITYTPNNKKSICSYYAYPKK